MSKIAVTKAIIVASLIVPCLPPGLQAATPQAGKSTASSQDQSAAVFYTLGVIQSRIEQGKLDDETGHAIEQVLKTAPNNARAHWVAARYYQKLGMNALSDAEFATADRLDPQQPEAVLDSFNSKLEHDQVGDAMQDYSYLQQRFPDDPMILLLQARLYQGKGKQTDADWFIERAMEAAPVRVGVATAAGELRLRQGRPQEALKLALQDLAKQPDNYRANAVAGQAAMQLHRTEEGANFLRKAFALKSNDKMYNNAYVASFYRARLYADAIEPAMLYMAQCTVAKEMDTAKQQLVAILKQVNQKEAENMAEAADRVLKLAPWQSRLHLGLGDVYDHLGWYAEAEQHYLKGIKLNPAIGRAYFRLAQDKERDRQLPQALYLYKLAYDKDPKDPQIQLGYRRCIERVANHNNDLALQLKNWLHKPQ